MPWLSFSASISNIRRYNVCIMVGWYRYKVHGRGGTRKSLEELSKTQGRKSLALVARCRHWTRHIPLANRRDRAWHSRLGYIRKPRNSSHYYLTIYIWDIAPNIKSIYRFLSQSVSFRSFRGISYTGRKHVPDTNTRNQSLRYQKEYQIYYSLTTKQLAKLNSIIHTLNDNVKPV